VTMHERLDSAIGPCVIPGGKERHLDLILDVCEKAKAPGTSLPSLASEPTAGLDAPAASQETSEEAAA